MQGKYFYSLTPFAPRGTFTLKLFDHESDMMINGTYGKVENDYLDFTCVRNVDPQHAPGHSGSCEGILELKLPDGSMFWLYGAKSGSTYDIKEGKSIHPALPDYEYTIDNIDYGPKRQFNAFKPHLEPVDFYCKRDPSAKCKWNDCACAFNDDNGHGWFAHLIPDPIDDENSSLGSRTQLGIHPSQGLGFTNGCIGIDQTVDTRFISDFIDDYIKEIGPTLKVKVYASIP